MKIWREKERFAKEGRNRVLLKLWFCFRNSSDLRRGVKEKKEIVNWWKEGKQRLLLCLFLCLERAVGCGDAERGKRGGRKSTKAFRDLDLLPWCFVFFLSISNFATQGCSERCRFEWFMVWTMSFWLGWLKPVTLGVTVIGLWVLICVSGWKVYGSDDWALG